MDSEERQITPEPDLEGPMLLVDPALSEQRRGIATQQLKKRSRGTSLIYASQDISQNQQKLDAHNSHSVRNSSAKVKKQVKTFDSTANLMLSRE